MIINDRFVVFAGHCESVFTPHRPRSTSRATLIRDGTIYSEYIELRRVFVHPGFKHPSLYNDIAVGQLGRRILYDFDKYGDSPACLSDGKKNIDGLEAVVQGYGTTETGKPSDQLIAAKVTMISNANCAKRLIGNTTDDSDLQTDLQLTLKYGLNNQLMCTEGIYNATIKFHSVTELS